MTATALSLRHLGWRVDADGAIGRLDLGRPPLNLLNGAMLEEMAAVLEGAAHRPDLKVLVIQSAAGSRAFSAGVEVAEHTADRVEAMLEVFHRVCLAVVEFPTPTVAVVQGAALGGGCELAMACDLVVASAAARFGQPEIKLAAFAPVASVMLPAIVGSKRAADWLLTGRTVTAEEAYAAGLVSRLAADGELDRVAEGVIGELTGSSGAALRLAKRASRLGAVAGSERGWIAEAERIYLEELMATEDAHEGLAAFMAKRPATWRNR